MEIDSDAVQEPGEPIERILAPFQRFLHAQTTSGLLLMAATALALAWANSPWSESYANL